MEFQDGFKYTQMIYSFLHTPGGLIVLKIICPMIVGYAVHTLYFLFQRARQKENKYLTEFCGYIGNLVFSIIMTYAFPNGYTFAQASIVGAIFGSCAIVLHLGITRIIWPYIVRPRLERMIKKKE